jgi:hypothetical protein
MTVDNATRGIQAERLLVHYAHNTSRISDLGGIQPASELLTDLLADMMHFTHAMHIDMRRCIDTAAMHFEAEISESGSRE